MKKIILSLFPIVLLIFACCSEKPETEITEQARNELRQDAGEFMESLKTVLVKEMQTNGIAAAVSVCSDTAQILTSNYGVNKDIYIKRVSFKNRNTGNYPDEFETKGLKYFEDLKTSGSLDETSELFDVEETGDVKDIRYMKPIIVQAPCLNCHGKTENISAEVKEIINNKYPEDKATGYQVGDLRGAVSVRKKM